MRAPLAVIQLDEPMVIGVLIGAFASIVFIARQWSVDQRRWTRVIRALRGECQALRQQNRELLSRAADISRAFIEYRDQFPPPDLPAAEPGGPGLPP